MDWIGKVNGYAQPAGLADAQTALKTSRDSRPADQGTNSTSLNNTGCLHATKTAPPITFMVYTGLPPRQNSAPWPSRSWTIKPKPASK